MKATATRLRKRPDLPASGATKCCTDIVSSPVPPAHTSSGVRLERVQELKRSRRACLLHAPGPPGPRCGLSLSPAWPPRNERRGAVETTGPTEWGPIETIGGYYCRARIETSPRAEASRLPRC